MRKVKQAFERLSGKEIKREGRLNSLILTIAAASALVGVPAAVQAQDLTDNAKYAAIVVDAQSGEVFYARRADSARYPASLTKLMTLYMAFDALAQGKLKPDDQIVMSQRAVGQAPVKVYLKAGDTIDVDTAMRLTALYSANDLAVALAEKIGGNEERFAALMTIKAQELGMTQTRFVNANGLPDARQLSSARDLAILARAIMRDYPQYYGYFNIDSMEYRGHTYVNHNPLHGIPGVDGMKTGFTNAAGYNLVASQVKDGHRLIAVMLGGSNKTQRREHVTELMNTGFDVIERRSHGEVITVAQAEFTKRGVGVDTEVKLPAGATPYTLLASNNAPLTDSQLRDTLAASEQANADDEDVQRLSAQVKAPSVVQTLTQTQAPAPAPALQTNAAQPYYTIKAAAPAPAPAPVKPVVNKSEENMANAVKLATASKAKTTVAANDDDGKPAKGKKKKNPDAIWSIQVGAFKEKSLATNWIKDLKSRFDDSLAAGTSQISKNENGWYRTRFAELTKEQAQGACRKMSAKRLDCVVIKPDA
ncbi:MAG TPA: D-alanyl-D-alanine carboxypeptidase [Asticcacaulis sp.]|nr:D-alanyl-D-alanine carboxypeptidase [Asticcacaulis sp.]